MKCFLWLSLMVVWAQAIPQPQTTDPAAECDIAAAVRDTVTCLVDSEVGQRVLGTSRLDVTNELTNANWEAFVDHMMTHKEGEGAFAALIPDADDRAALGLEVALFLDDSVFADNHEDVRREICELFQQTMYCIARYTRHCASHMDELLEQDIKATMGLGDDFQLPTEIGARSFAYMLEKQLCYLCQEKSGEEFAAPLKLVTETILDGDKRTTLRSFKEEQKRLTIYDECPAGEDLGLPALNWPEGAPAFKEALLTQALSDACQLHELVDCLAEEIHQSVNPDTPSVIGTCVHIAFHHAFGCEGLATQIPESVGTCESNLARGKQDAIDAENAI